MDGASLCLGLFGVLISYLFTLVTDELTRLIQDEIPLCIFFRYDIILVDQTRYGVNVKLKIL